MLFPKGKKCPVCGRYMMSKYYKSYGILCERYACSCGYYRENNIRKKKEGIQIE